MVVVYGASGHAKEITFFLRQMQVGIDFVVDRNPLPDSKLFDVDIIDEDCFLQRFSTTEGIHFYVAIGDMQLRKKVVTRIRDVFPRSLFPNLCASALIPDKEQALIQMGEGNVFFPGTSFTTHINIGNHNHFNQGASVSHDVVIGDFNTFSPGVRIAGSVRVGSDTFWGVNALAIHNVIIPDQCIIGAGAVVVTSIVEPGTYVGVPAKKIK